MHFSVDVVIHYYSPNVPKEFTLLPVELNILSFVIGMLQSAVDFQHFSLVSIQTW